MSNKYSVGGYRIAIQARTARTLLVEGKDDKELFSVLKMSCQNDRDVLVDAIDILEGEEVCGLGNKAKIDFFIGKVSTLPGFTDKVRCIVDREWEDLLDEAGGVLPWQPPIPAGVRYKTAGHSIENYGFSEEFVDCYLTHFGGQVANRELINKTIGMVPSLLSACAAFSEVIRDRQLISRCSSVMDLCDIEWDNERVKIKDSLVNKLCQRGGLNCAGLIEDFEETYTNKWLIAPYCDDAKFHAHGHIGEMLLWTGLGRFLQLNGVSEAVAREIATGRKDERRRVWHGWLSKLSSQEVEPLLDVLN